MDVTMYVLEGSWNTKNSDGCQVLGVSDDILPLRKRLDGIAESKAKEFVHDEMEGELSEDIGDRSYEVRDEVMGLFLYHRTESLYFGATYGQDQPRDGKNRPHQ